MKSATWLLLILPLISNAQSFHSARILDKETKEPLIAATIRFGTSGTGTISNADGRFDIPDSVSSLIISYVGYKTDTLSVTHRPADYFLTPMDIRLPEVLVAGDQDPALAIIRQAIANKSIHYKGLKSYSFSAYSKEILRSDGKPASIQETLIDGVFEPGKELKEFVKSVSKTENIKKERMSAPTQGSFPDLYANQFDLNEDIKIVLPLADNAFDYYTYRLENSRVDGNQTFYTIAIIPLSNELPLVTGNLTIEGENYALAGAEIRNGPGIRFPYIEKLHYGLKQVFSHESGYWIPLFTETRMGFEINLGGLIRLDELDFLKTYTLSNIQVNADIPPAISKSRKSVHGGYTTDTSATVKIPDYLKNRRSKRPLDLENMRVEPAAKPFELSVAVFDSLRPIPLSMEEQRAFRELDSTKTLETLIKPEGPLAGLATVSAGDDPKENEKSFTDRFMDFFRLRNNRVEGLTPLLEFTYDSLKSPLYLNAKTGYSLGMKAFTGEATVGWYTGPDFLDMAWVSVYQRSFSTQPIHRSTELLNTITQSVFASDAWNYTIQHGWESGYRYYPYDSLSVFLAFRDFTVFHEQNHEPWSVFNRTLPVRPNASFPEGRDRQIRLGGWWLEDPNGFSPVMTHGIRFETVHSFPSLGSDFSYHQAFLTAQTRIPTFFSDALLPPELTIRADLGKTWNSSDARLLITPGTATRHFALPPTFRGLEPWELAGTGMASVYLSHNWRSLPFQGSWLNWFREKAIEIQTYGGWVTVENPVKIAGTSSIQLPYWEAGMGVSRILGFLQTDLTYTSRKTWTWSVGFGMIF